jgi:hypothetical protein
MSAETDDWNRGKNVKKLLTCGAVIGVACIGFLGACSDVEQAQNDVTYSDRPAYVKCTTIGGSPMYEGWTSGRVIYDDGGRLTFTDGSSKRLITTEGECIVRYS